MISSLANYQTMLGYSQKRRATWQLAGPNSTWFQTSRLFPHGTVVTIPTAGSVPSRTEAWAVGQANGAAALRLGRARIARSGIWSGFHAEGAMLVDVLSWAGGLSGNVAGEQTTNLPTAPLTRYTNGVGVQVALEVFGAVGATLSEPTVRYTNSDGVPNRQTLPMQVLGASGIQSAGFVIGLPLQPGDRGVRSVEGLTLSAGTGTVGNLGVSLYKPLLLIPIFLDDEADWNILSLGSAPRILDDACLELLAFGGGSGNDAACPGSLVATFVEDDA